MTYPIPNNSWRKNFIIEEKHTNNEKEDSFDAGLYLEIFGPQKEEENTLAIVMSKT